MVNFCKMSWLWLRLGFMGFGGPAAQIAWMEREVVQRHGWIDRGCLRHALGFCMALPGPEATQLAVYVGWLLHGVRGGVVAALGFILPGAMVMWALSWLALAGRENIWITAGLHGLQPAVLGILAVTLFQMMRRENSLPWITVGAFAAMLGGAPFAVILIFAGLAGRVFAKAEPFAPTLTPPGRCISPPLIATGLAVWLVPVGFAVWSRQPVLGELGLFLSKISLTTFGGAYAILPDVAREAVEVRQWLPAQEMINGLGLAETTPGPLILVLQYVGFAAGWHQPGTLPPWLAGTLGAVLASWVTFTPAVLLVLIGAPLMERLRTATGWQKTLQGVFAAVSGVIGYLAVWLATKILFPNGILDIWNLLSAGAYCVLAQKKCPVPFIVMLAVAFGMARNFV